MTELFLGAVAGGEIGRRALQGDSFNGGYGYGLSFTDQRILGFSYKRMLSRSCYPGYLVFLAFVVSLTSAIVYARLSGIPSDQPVPLLFGPPPALAGLSLILLFLGPWRAGKRIHVEKPNSLLDLTNRSPDLALDTSSISEVSLQNAVFNILTKSGQWYSFMVSMAGYTVGRPSRWRGQQRQLLDLFQKFCLMDPPIKMFIKQGREWKILTQAVAPPNWSPDSTL